MNTSVFVNNLPRLNRRTKHIKLLHRFEHTPFLLIIIPLCLRGDLRTFPQRRKIGWGRGLVVKKILLADDSRLFLEVESTLFRRTGAEITMAMCGAEALRKVATEKPDLVVLDFMMPDMTGDKVCAQIK